MDNLDKFKPVLDRLGSASDGVEISIKIGNIISAVNHPWKTQMTIIWLEAAESYSRNGAFLHWFCIPGGFPSVFDANCTTDEIGSISRPKKNLMDQWKALQRAAPQTPGSPKLGRTAPDNKWVFEHNGRSDKFHWGVARKLDTYVRIMWDRFFPHSSVPGQYIFVAAEKDKAVELRSKLDNFKSRLMVELMIDIQVNQGLVFVSPLIVQLVWFVVSDAIVDDVKSGLAGIANLQGGLSVILA